MGKITVTVTNEHPDASASEASVVAEIRRDGPLRAASLGLSLAEAKDLLANRSEPGGPSAARCAHRRVSVLSRSGRTP